MDKFLAILDQVILFVTNLSPTVYIVIAAILEAVMRLWKTEKPIGFLVAVSAIIKLGIAAGQKVVALLATLDGFVNKIIPQKTK